MNCLCGPKYNIRIATEFCCNGFFTIYADIYSTVQWSGISFWHRTFKQIGPEAVENWETGFIFDLEQCTYFFPRWATVLKVASSRIDPDGTPWGSTRPRSPTQSHSNLKRLNESMVAYLCPLNARWIIATCNIIMFYLYATYSCQHAK